MKVFGPFLITIWLFISIGLNLCWFISIHETKPPETAKVTDVRSDDSAPPVSKQSSVGTTTDTGERIVPYGGQSYFFKFTGPNFLRELDDFRLEHTELELIDVTGNGYGRYGKNTGFFVFFREKNPAISEIP